MTSLHHSALACFFVVRIPSIRYIGQKLIAAVNINTIPTILAMRPPVDVKPPNLNRAKAIKTIPATIRIIWSAEPTFLIKDIIDATEVCEM